MVRLLLGTPDRLWVASEGSFVLLDGREALRVALPEGLDAGRARLPRLRPPIRDSLGYHTLDAEAQAAEHAVFVVQLLWRRSPQQPDNHLAPPFILTFTLLSVGSAADFSARPRRYMELEN